MGVGRLIGKLFGGEAAENEAVLRAYGKLPLYAEYRRLELAPGAPTAFSQWLDAGRLAWVRSPNKSAAGVTQSSRLLIGLKDAKETIVASLWDSRDSLGRVFPFAFFVVCPPAALGKDPVERWITASAIHHDFDRLYAELHALGSGGDFYRFYQKRTIPLRRADLEERVRQVCDDAGRIAADDWFRALVLDGEIPAPAWFAELSRRSERWKTQPAALGELALSCPLARGIPYATQVVLWLEWLGESLRKTDRMPWLILPTDSDRPAPTLHLVVRDLLPDDYQLLTTDEPTYGFIERLAAVPTAEPPSALSPEIDTPTDSLLAWLKQHAP